jgi:hypothetical protein
MLRGRQRRHSPRSRKIVLCVAVRFAIHERLRAIWRPLERSHSLQPLFDFNLRGHGLLLLISSGWDQRMCDRMYREHHAIRNSNLSQKFGYVCFYRALLDPQRSRDFLVRAARH